MSETQGSRGRLVKLQFLNPALSPPDYSDLLEVKDIGEVGFTSGLVDMTNRDSTIMEYQTQLPEGTEVQYGGNHVADDAGQDLMRTWALEGKPHSFRLNNTETGQLVDFKMVVLGAKLNPDFDSAFRYIFNGKVVTIPVLSTP